MLICLKISVVLNQKVLFLNQIVFLCYEEIYLDIDKLITLTGMVIGSSMIMAQMYSAYFSCSTCGYHVQVEIDHDQIVVPTLCTSCNKAHSFELIHNRSLFADKQFIKLQETPGLFLVFKIN